MKRIFHFLLLSAWLLVLQGCGSPLDRPGSRGEVTPVPAETAADDDNATAVIEAETLIPLPEELVCNKTYVFTVEATQIRVDCANFHYGLLYREALRKADERVARQRCWRWNGTCTQPTYYLVLEDGRCTNGRATVTLGMAFRCIEEDAPDPVKGLELRLDSDLREPFRRLLVDPPTPLPNERFATEQRPPDGTFEDCDYEMKYWLTYRETVSSCEAVTNYGPFLLKARDEANRVFEASLCQPVQECRKRFWEEVGASWKCEENKVIVLYIFRGRCGPR